MRVRAPDGRAWWLAYGMNVHPGGDAASFLAAIQTTVLPLRDRLGVTGPLGLAVRFSDAGVQELLAAPALARELGAVLEVQDLVPFTGNAFVHGTFHRAAVKDGVYRPPWGDPARTAYTLAFAKLMASWHPAGAEVSLSTAPGSWRAWSDDPYQDAGRAAALVACASGLAALAERTGVVVRLGLEPEPGCTLERSSEAIAFFEGPLAEAARSPSEHDAVRQHLGVCFDVCHQAVVHEDVAQSLAEFVAAGVPITKLQASCALEAADPSDPATRTALAAFDEPTYLHQVGLPPGSAPPGSAPALVVPDLPQALADPALASRAPWRVHFHVPVDRRASVPPLTTTWPALDAALGEVATRPVTQHLEVETYTFDVLPEGERSAGSGDDLVASLEREMRAVLSVLATHGIRPEDA